MPNGAEADDFSRRWLENWMVARRRARRRALARTL
jgi:hypothetical protein